MTRPHHIVFAFDPYIVLLIHVVVAPATFIFVHNNSPWLGLYRKAPVWSINTFDSLWNTTGKFVLAELSETVPVVDNVAVSAFPVNGPAKASAVTVPSKNPSLNSLSDFPRSIILSDPGYKALPSNINCFSLPA